MSQDTFNAKHQRLSRLNVQFKIGPINYRDVWDWLDVNKGFLSHLYVDEKHEKLRLPPVTDSNVRPADKLCLELLTSGGYVINKYVYENMYQ